MKFIWKIVLVFWIMLSAMFMIAQTGAWADQGIIDQSSATELEYLLTLFVWIVFALVGSDLVKEFDSVNLKYQTAIAGVLTASVCGAILHWAWTAPNAGLARLGVVYALACALVIGLPVIQRTTHWDRFVGKIKRGLSA